MFRQRRFWIVALFLLTTLSTAGWVGYQQRRFKHFAVHEPDMMFRSGWLAPSALSHLIETYQIRAVVNLCEPTEMTPAMWDGERTAVASSGAKLFAVPLKNTVNFDEHTWAPHLAILNDPDNYPMLVHCQHGVTRTAMFLTAYDVIHRGKTAQESLDIQPLFGHEKRANVHVRAFGKNLDEFYREHRDRLAANPTGTLR